MYKKIYKQTVKKCSEDITGITFLILVYISIFYFEKKINILINEYLTVEKSWSNTFIDLVITIGSITILFYFGKKIIRNKYQYSYNQFFILIAFLILFSFMSLVETKWEYTTLFYESKIGVTHISVLLIVLIFFICLGIYNFIVPNVVKQTIIFREDNALNCNFDESDLLNYTHIVKNLKEKLTVQDFNKSFTVGIIGPWGNGKSSFISLLKKEFESEEEIISVSFLPYLNHTASEISTEFFHSFQNALTPYSGKLSNLILDYSNKLLNLYNDKNLNNFLMKDLRRSNTESANDTFEIINEALTQINKKILVFVDDLDRLNQEEILQVLKLIRNTANFKNTVFIVAMDKGYILNRLNNDDAILSSRFIDKFFQLEIYLPEIDESILIQEFLNIIENSIVDEQTKIKIKDVISSNKTLFRDYIKNLRDVKRVCNQIIFEYEFINDEIKLEDFINFILLKLNFPEFINKLKNNPLSYLEKSDNYFQLVKSSNDNADDIFNNAQRNIENQEFKQYEIYNQFFDDDKFCNEEVAKLNCDGKKLLIKTLIILFGDTSELTSNSIKFENNFRRFMQLNYKSSDFLNKNFIEIIEKTDFNSINNEIEVIIQKEQQAELVDRMKYFTPNSDNQFKTALIIYLILLDTLTENNLQEYDILRNLSVMTRIHTSENKNNTFNLKELSGWFVNEVINTDVYNVDTQLKVISYLWEVKNSTKLWEIETSKIEEIVIKKFNAFLNIYDGNLWTVRDFSFYRIYHGVKIIGEIRVKIIENFKSFLNKNKIEVFCAQITDYDGFNHNTYKITNTAIEIFGSKEKFKDFVENHKDRNTPFIVEYLEFLKLCDITKFSIPIVYKFKNNIFKDKSDFWRSQNNNQYENSFPIVQIFWEVTNDVSNYLKSLNQFDNSDYRLSDLKFFSYEEKFYMVLSHSYGTDEEHTTEYMNKIYNTLQRAYDNRLTLKPNLQNQFVIELNDEIIVSVFSVQPN